MCRRTPVITCTAEDMATLIEWSHSRTMEARMVERANIVLNCLKGEPFERHRQSDGDSPKCHN